MEPQERIVGRARDEVGDPGLARAIRPGHDRQRPRLARGCVAARALDRVGPAPVDDLVRAVADRRERGRAPRQQPVVDLEPAPDQATPRRAMPVDDRVPRQRLAGRDHVTHGQPGGPPSGIVAPRVAQVGDDDVTRRAARAEIDRRRPVEEDPAFLTGTRPKVERQAVEHLQPGREPGQRGSQETMRTGPDPVVRRVPHGAQVDRSGQRTRGRHRARSRTGRRSLY